MRSTRQQPVSRHAGSKNTCWYHGSAAVSTTDRDRSVVCGSKVKHNTGKAHISRSRCRESFGIDFGAPNDAVVW
eukprot:2277377-Rhodomonas_salina.2